MSQREELAGLLLKVTKDQRTAQRVADYLIRNRVTVLPCRIGDKVWCLRQCGKIVVPKEGIVSEMYFGDDMEIGIKVRCQRTGKYARDIFRTREEAEKAMEERRHGKA